MLSHHPAARTSFCGLLHTTTYRHASMLTDTDTDIKPLCSAPDRYIRRAQPAANLNRVNSIQSY